MTMSCISCSLLSTIKNVSPSSNEYSSSSSSLSNVSPNSSHDISLKPAKAPLMNKKKPRQPSVIEIERAIGTGRFRDTDPRELEAEKDVRFDMKTLSFPGRFENPIQKRLRNTGEWIIDRTEKRFRFSGQLIFKVTFMWILPIWAFSVLVVSGFIDLPFINHFIDR